MDEYKDVTKSFFKAGVPGLALAQDNMIIASLHDVARKYNVSFSLSGNNFSTESILQRGDGVNIEDIKHIRAIHK